MFFLSCVFFLASSPLFIFVSAVSGQTSGETLGGDPGRRPWGETLKETLWRRWKETLEGDPGGEA